MDEERTDVTPLPTSEDQAPEVRKITREAFLAKVKDGGDDGLVEIAAWLYDMREANVEEFRAVVAEVYAEADRLREGDQR